MLMLSLKRNETNTGIDMKTEKEFINMGRLIGATARLEAGALDVRDLLKHMGYDAPGEGVGDELQQIANLAKTVATKLGINKQTDALLALQEAHLESDKAVAEAFAKTIDVFAPMLDGDEESSE